MENIKECLIEFINNPYNDIINFNLAVAYEEEKQYASAFSYYLRSAEFTDNNILASESLVRCSLCINKQGERDQKELYFIKHAITASPNSLEPYYIASLYFSWRSGNIPEKRNWLDSYMYANIAINLIENNLECKEKFRIPIDFEVYDLYYQKAYAGTNIGKINEAREIYTKILQNYELSDSTKNLIIIKLNKLPEPNHPIISYSKNNLDNLKLIFNNSNKIDVNYSQIYQDMYVLSMNNGKTKGTYLEIGAGDYKYGNNTYLLESEFNWTGVSIDFNQNLVNNFNHNRNNNCICSDATTINYLKLLKNNYKSTNIDYLQLDCDPPNITFDILSKIPFDQYKFGVITYEHDFYNDVTGSYREKSREFLKEKGYKLIAGNISPYGDKCPFEDWWIHPDLIDKNIWKLFERDNDEPINGEKYMLTKSKYIKKKQEKNIITFGTDDLFKNQKIRFKEQATDIDFFDSIIIEDEKTIKPLLKEHEEFIMNNKRGYGYWIWKPIIIKNQFEKMSENDILFYLDCGSSIINNNTDKLNEYIDNLKDKDIIVFDIYDQLTRKFMKKNVINEFNIRNDILDKCLIEGGCIIIKKTNFSIKFLNLWLDTMTKNKYSLVNDDLLNLEQDKDFLEHRHDQSILTILARQYDNIYVCDGMKELYNSGPIFHTRLTDQGPRKYAKPINTLDMKKNTNLIKDLYHYIPCHDQKGNDIYRVNKDNLQMTLLNASNDPSIIAINTEGYVKNHIEKLEQIPGWGWNLKTNESNGIYIKKTINDKLIKCSKSSIPVLGTLVCTTTKWVEKQIQSIDFPIENYIIINNNENFLAKKLDILVSKGNKFIKNFKVYHMPYNLGCAEGWNTIIKSFLFSPYWVIVNDDVSFTPGFLKELHETALKNPDAGLIHGNPFTQHLLTSFGLFDMFLIRDWIIKDFGLFDTNFYPAYYEDYDYIFRLINSSVKIINQLKHKYYHGDTFEYFKSGQNTKKFSNKLSNKLTYIKSINYNSPFILQVFRDDEGVSVFKQQLGIFQNIIQKYQ